MKLGVIDYAFLRMETVEFPSHVAGLMIYQIPEEYDGNFVKALRDNLLKQKRISPPFNMKLRNGGFMPTWPEWEEDDNFDLNFHLRHSALPAPGSQQDLVDLTNRLHARQLDRAHPLWEMYLIEGLEGNRFCVYFKIHHAVVDGVGATKIFENVMSEERDMTKALAIWNPQIQKAERATASTNIFKSVIEPSKKLIKAALSTPEAILSLAAPATGIKKTKAGSIYRGARTMFSRKISSSRAFGFSEILLSEVKSVSKDMGVTVNDIFLAVCSGALGRYMQRNKYPANRDYAAMVPVALPREEGQTSNAISALMIKVHAHIKDPIQRVKLINESAADAKRDFQALSPEVRDTRTFLTQSSMVLVNQLGLADKTPPPISLVISNVPGIQTKRYMMGAELIGSYPMSMLTPGGGLNITVCSYTDKMQFGLLSTPEIAPDIQSVADMIVAEFELLKSALLDSSEQPEPKTKTPAKARRLSRKPAKKAVSKAKTSASTSKQAETPVAKKTTAVKSSAKKTSAKKASVKKTGVKKASAKTISGKTSAKKTNAIKKTAATKGVKSTATAMATASKKPAPTRKTKVSKASQ